MCPKHFHVLIRPPAQALPTVGQKDKLPRPSCCGLLMRALLHLDELLSFRANASGAQKVHDPIIFGKPCGWFIATQ